MLDALHSKSGLVDAPQHSCLEYLKMQYLENDGTVSRAGKCRYWKILDQIALLENAVPDK